jgi:hypothetical protein
MSQRTRESAPGQGQCGNRPGGGRAAPSSRAGTGPHTAMAAKRSEESHAEAGRVALFCKFSTRLGLQGASGSIVEEV